MEQNKIKLDIQDTILANVLSDALQERNYIISDTSTKQYDVCLRDTGKNGENDIILSVPVRIGEVLDKVQSLLAEQHAEDFAHAIDWGGFSFSPKIKVLKYGEKKISLTEKETDMLLYLHKKKDQVVSRQELLEYVWRYNADINTRTLETHIYRLRQKIADLSGGTSLISTEEKGYALSLGSETNI